jgi:ATP synthase subunit 6
MALNFKNILLSPLEQFEILPVFSLYFENIDFSLTNEAIILFVISICVYLFKQSIVKQSDKSLYIVPSRWQLIFEGVYKIILSMVVETIGINRGQKFFPLIFSLFFYVLCLNVVGLVPYSFTLTSHFIVTFSLSLAIFIGINIICIRTHGIVFFSIFLPSGTSAALAFLLVPIELISYVFKPVSLSIRLFANMMGGHILLKVIAGFSWSLMSCTGIFFIFHYIPILILIPLFGLEVAVALIQAYVFSILNCVYLSDAINLH